MELTLKNLRIENLFSYGLDSNYLDFESTPLTLILGQTNGNLALSNGTGKSAIFNSILWALYGRLLSGKAYDTIVKPSSSKGQVVLTLGLDQKNLVITRSRDIQKQKTSLDLNLDGICLTAETLVETEKKLVSLVRLPFSMFRNSLYFGQEDLEHFGSQSSSSKKDLFSSIIKLQVIDLALEKTKILFNEAFLARDKLYLEKEWINKEKEFYLPLASLKSNLVSLGEEEALCLKVRDDFSLQLNQQNDVLLSNTKDLFDLLFKSKEYYSLVEKSQSITFRQESSTKGFVRDQDSIKTKLQSLDKDITIFKSENILVFDQAKLDSLDFSLKKLRFLDQNYIKKIARFDVQLAEIKVEKDILAQRLASLKRLGEVCPLCETRITLSKSANLSGACVSKIDLLSQRSFKLVDDKAKICLDKEDNKVKLTENEKAKSVLLSVLAKKEKLSKLLNEKSLLTEKLLIHETAFNKSIAELNDELCQTQELLNAFTCNFEEQKEFLTLKKQKIQVNINDITLEITKLDENLKNLAVERGVIEGSISKIESYDKKLKTIQRDLLIASAELNKFDILKKAFGPKGIKTFIVEDVLSAFELCVNNYVKLLFNHDVHISFSTQAAKKNSDELLDRFDVIISFKGIIKLYSCFSPGEKRRFDLALKLALADLIKQNFGVIPQFLFFDEAMDSLDEDGKDRFLNLVNDLAVSTKTILVVSHDPAIQEFFRSIIFVNKVDDCSKLLSY